MWVFFLSFSVPQGSILDPILFTIFANALSATAQDCLLAQYAAEPQFLYLVPVNNMRTEEKKTRETLAQSKRYFNINGLKINPNKTHCNFTCSHQSTDKIPVYTTIESEGCYSSPNTSVERSRSTHRQISNTWDSFRQHLKKGNNRHNNLLRLHKKKNLLIWGSLILLKHMTFN